MNVTEALASRMSCRAFLPTPVPEATVRAILDAARRSPSGGNLQPWRVYALAGGAARRVARDRAREAAGAPARRGSEYDIYPPGLWEPYRSRRYKCGEDLYATIGVAREDKFGRLLQFARNYEFFGAPVGCSSASTAAWGRRNGRTSACTCRASCCSRASTACTPARRKRGRSGTARSANSSGCRRELMLFSGMALGYRDESAPINRLRTDRAPLEEIATLRGF